MPLKLQQSYYYVCMYYCTHVLQYALPCMHIVACIPSQQTGAVVGDNVLRQLYAQLYATIECYTTCPGVTITSIRPGAICRNWITAQ
jgi:hypothetical protein